MRMDRSWKLLLKIIIDFTLTLCVAAPILILWIIGVPFQRGFFCNDTSLLHPYREDTISLSVLVAVGICVPVITIFIVEITRGQLNADGDRQLRLFSWNVSPTFQNLYTYIGYFNFGAAVSQTITDIAKYSIGRLRPHFLSLCNPRMSGVTTCNDDQNLNRYIQDDFNCFNPSATEKMLRESRLSFPSGHASFGFYTMIFCALYLHKRLNWKGSQLLKHALQFALVVFALYTALSRISDYKHHWSDVLAGSILGTAVALTTRLIMISRSTESDQSHKLPLRQVTIGV